MKNINLKKNLFDIVMLILVVYIVFDYFDNRRKIQNLNYGIKANALRKTLNIPIIDDYMTAEDKHGEFFGNRWKSWREKPMENEILHVWKTVIPSENEAFKLDKELDGYRIREANGRIRQLNISSKIINDSAATRTGRIFYTSKPRNTMELNEIGIDSTLNNWRIKYLNKK